MMVRHPHLDAANLVRLPQFRPSEHFRGELHLVASKSALLLAKVLFVAEALAAELERTIVERAPV